MTINSCIRCGYSHKRLDIIKQHLSRKSICEPIITNVDINTCLKVLKNPELRESILISEIKRLKTEVIPDIKNSITTGDNSPVNNNINSNNININLTLSYENTDYSVIKNQLSQCIKKNKRIDNEKLLKLIHFNKEHPENQNVMILNRNKKRVMAFNGSAFEEIGEGDQDIYDFIENLLNKTLDNTDENDGKTQMALDNSLEEHSNEKNREAETNKVMRVLYNNRNQVLKNLKK